MLKTAIIGLGDISKVHLPIVRALPFTELVAVCDINTKLAKSVDNVPFYESAHALLDEVKPDVVHICLPHYLHYPMAKLAAEHGANVFCEKPLALNLAEAESFVNLITAYPGLRFGLCLQNRYNKSVTEMLNIIKSGQKGKVISVKSLVAWSRGKEYFAASPWRGKMAEAGGGAMINQSIHTLDLMQLFAGEMDSIKGNICQMLDMDIEVEDTASAVINFKNGARGMFFATITNFKNTNVEIEITLENGTYFIRDNSLLEQTEEKYKLICEDEKLSGTKFYYGASHKRAITEFYRSLEEKTSNFIVASEGLMSLKMIDAIRKSSDTNTAVVL